MGQFFEELRRRSVFRLGAAYLAVSWLLLQVLDVLRDIFVLPDWVGRFTFFALLIGFPLALILAWAYEITPEGVKPSEEVESPTNVVRFGGRKIDFVIIGALSLIIVLLVVDSYVVRPDRPIISGGPPMVRGATRLTQSQVTLPPVTSQYPMVTDGLRIYFSDWGTGTMGMLQMPVNGGEAVRMPPMFDDGYKARPSALTPDGSHLVVSAWLPGASENSLWQWPVVGGQPRLMGEGADAVYSPDGQRVFYTDGSRNMFIANADLTEPHELGSAPGKIHWPKFSPDGSRIRFVVQTDFPGIWEISVDGSDLHRLLPDWGFTDHCCGSWTPDGKYYVFEATRDYRTQLWAIREQDGQSVDDGPTPVQITTGPLDFQRATIIEDGKKILAMGWQLRGEVVRYDSDVKRFLSIPGLESLSAEWLAYSRGGERLAYISYPEADLWRSDGDGSRRLQLSNPPMRAADPNWSPDERSIAFVGWLPGQSWKIYIISGEGGLPQPVTAEDRQEWSPTWSADGTSLAFSATGKDKIQILDVASGTISELDGSEDMYSPQWSPDGRYLATRSNRSLVLFDFTTGLSEVLLEDVIFTAHYWANDDRYVYYHDPFWREPDQATYRVDIQDKTVEKIARTGDVLISWGVWRPWVGITPDGAPIQLRDLSIHHIYALDWLPDIGTEIDSSWLTE